MTRWPPPQAFRILLTRWIVSDTLLIFTALTTLPQAVDLREAPNVRAESDRGEDPDPRGHPAKSSGEAVEPSNVTWDDLPGRVLQNLVAGRRIGVVELVCWIADRRPGNLEDDAVSTMALGLLTRFSGPDRRGRMVLVRDWSAYLARVAQKAKLQANEDASRLGRFNGGERIHALRDPVNSRRRLEAIEFLRILPRVCGSLSRSEQEAFADLMNEVLEGGARPPFSSKAESHRAAARRYRVRMKVARLLFGSEEETG